MASILHSGLDESGQVAAVRALKKKPLDEQDMHSLMELLMETRSPRVRNAAALTLVDKKVPIAKKAIFELLTSPTTKGARGTLLYALNEIGEPVPLHLLVGIILGDENYEAREEALSLICGGKAYFNEKELSEAIQRLMDTVRKEGRVGDHRHAIIDAVEYLRSYRPLGA